MRDQALASNSYAEAIAVFDRFALNFKGPDVRIRAMSLMHAHLLLLSGDTERGREKARSLLQLFDAEQIGRPEHFFARERATIHAMLGEDDRALVELANSQRRNGFVRWWYTAEQDPLFAHLRADLRFQALAETARQHRARQRALLEELRAEGKVPKRP
jgi:hypothetical protein